MKIHIVQKGDTLWELAKKYGVDFEEVKQLNSHLASPDMIMPGMKIKIPSTSKAVKKESAIVKEQPKAIPKEVKKETKMPYMDTSPKALPVIEEDDKEKQKVVKPEMPIQPLPQMPMQPIMQMPIFDFDQDIQFNFPQMPSYPAPKKEEVKHEAKEEVKHEVKEEVKVQPKPQPQMPKQQQMPVLQPMPEMPKQQQMPILQPMPEMPKQQQMPIQEQPLPQMPIQQPNFQPMPQYPCCWYVHPCYPFAPFPAMMPETYMPTPALPQKPLGGDCGCGSSSFPQPSMEAPMSFYPAQNAAGPEQVFDTEPNIAQTYPPQFNTNPVYPTPPTYPNFSAFQRNDEENKTSDE